MFGTKLKISKKLVGKKTYNGCVVEIQDEDQISKKIEFIKKFKKNGKQGITGLCTFENELCVFKISRYINHLPAHENSILESLNKISSFCPYFCEGNGVYKTKLCKDFRDQTNPFANNGKHLMDFDIMIMKHIKGKSLASFFKKDIDDKLILGSIKQVLGAIAVAQQEQNFTHYDLHSSNVIMQPTHQNNICLFILNEGQVCTRTYGVKPKIIDFGFSYSKINDKKPIYSSLAHTDIGFMSNLCDRMADPKIFLLSTAYESELYREDSKHMKLFRKLVYKIFNNIQYEVHSGWDKEYTNISAADKVIELISQIDGKKCEIFDRYNHFSMDIIQGLISLPLRKKNYNNIYLSFKILNNEMLKIENEIGSAMFNLYLYQKIVDFAYVFRNYYEDKNRRNLWDVAWDSYILTHRFSFKGFALLKSQYKRGINRLKSTSPNISFDGRQSLINHLINAYIIEVEDLDTNSLIEYLFLHSNSEIRKLVWQLLSSFLEHINKIEDNEKRENISKRYFDLLNYRIKYLKEKSSIDYEDILTELDPFGIIFSRILKLDKEHLMLLNDILELTDGNSGIFTANILEKVKESIEIDHTMILEILNKLASSKNQSIWLNERTSDMIIDIISTLKNKEISQQSELIINRIVEVMWNRGFHKFSDFG